MTTRARWMVGAVAFLFLATVAGQALAGPLGTTGQVSITTATGYYNGAVGAGEFTAYGYGGSLSNEAYKLDPLNPATGNIGNFDPSFQTFCIERTESAVIPAFFVVGSAAVLGGPGGSPDPISMGTAWLYSQFARGTLSGYFGGTRLAQAVLLQNAFWALEDDIAAPVGNPYYDAAMLNGGKTSAPVGAMGVYTLINFDTADHRDAFIRTGATDGRKQDYLYFVPDGGTTLMLLGGALMGLGALRRKFRA